MQDKKQREQRLKKNGQMLTDFGINLNIYHLCHYYPGRRDKTMQSRRKYLSFPNVRKI